MDFYYGHDSNDKAEANFHALLNYGNLHQAREDAAYFGNEDDPAAIHVALYTQPLAPRRRTRAGRNLRPIHHRAEGHAVDA